MKRIPTPRWLFVLLLMLPALAAGEEVRLRDGSSMRGRLVAIAGDSLSFRLSVGPLVQLHRSQVVAIVFDDSLASWALAAPRVNIPQPAPAGVAGTGALSIAFKDRNLSSKISIEHKKDWDAHERSNHIVLELFLDGAVVYSAVDTTMDKRIYKGHTTQLRNDANLEDFTVEVPAGIHQVQVIVRNRDADTFREDFDPEPLHAVLVVDGFEVHAGAGARIEVGIDKGTLKLGKAKLYRVQ